MAEYFEDNDEDEFEDEFEDEDDEDDEDEFASEEEVEMAWKAMFPNGNEDDGITDWMTREDKD
jgi:hypothetical protein